MFRNEGENMSFFIRREESEQGTGAGGRLRNVVLQYLGPIRMGGKNAPEFWSPFKRAWMKVPPYRDTMCD